MVLLVRKPKANEYVHQWPPTSNSSFQSISLSFTGAIAKNSGALQLKKAGEKFSHALSIPSSASAGVHCLWYPTHSIEHIAKAAFFKFDSGRLLGVCSVAVGILSQDPIKEMRHRFCR